MDFTLTPYDSRYSHPHPPRAIKLNGVVIGHLLDFDGPLDERVKAVGNDPEIQATLEAWWAERKRRAAAEREREDRAYRLRRAEEEAATLSNARKALAEYKRRREALSALAAEDADYI